MTSGQRPYVRRRGFKHAGRPFRLGPGVFDPVYHLSGIAFADHLGDLIPVGGTVLELGTGCGLLAAVAARRASLVVATDLSPAAAACARDNLADLTNVEVRCGDLFDPVAGERFNLIVTNPPYEVRSNHDATLASPDFLARFGREASAFADAAILGFPVDFAARLDITCIDWRLRHEIPTSGHALGIYTADLSQR